MVRAEMVSLLGRIMRADGSEAEQSSWLHRLEDELPNGDVWNLVYRIRGFDTPEAVLDEALRRVETNRILLGPPSGVGRQN